MQQKENEELKKYIKKIKENDINGLEELYKQYHKKIYSIAFSIVKNKDEAEDIMQIIFTKIQQMDKSKLPSEKEMTWIYSVTKNETLNFLKKKRGEISLDAIYEVKNKNDEIQEIEDIIEFNRLISKLKPKEKEIVSLKIVGNFSFQEISEWLHEPIGTIKWRYYKSLRTIKQIMGSLAMFIITFVIGIKVVLKDAKHKEQEMIQTEDKINTIDTNKEETQNIAQQENNSQREENQEQNSELQDSIQKDNTIKGDTENKTNTINTIEGENNEIKQETIIEQEVTENHISYIGIGIIGISVIFLIITIIFFIKYQLKTKKKLSK